MHYYFVLTFKYNYNHVIVLFSWGYLYEDKSKYGVGIRAVKGIISDNQLFIAYKQNDDGLVHMGARRNDQQLNCAEVLKKAVSGLEGATAGGHVPAAGARCKKEDFNQFKKNLIKILGE